jgi:hypothetical protein
VTAAWERGELGAGAVALDALHGFGDVGEDAVVFAVDEAEGGFEGGELAGDFGEAFDAEAGACLDEGLARRRGCGARAGRASRPMRSLDRPAC